jgi:hypothetical protein
MELCYEADIFRPPASLLEVLIPLWVVVLIIVTPVTLIALWDYRHKLLKKKPEEIRLNKLQTRIVKYWQEHVLRGYCMTPQDLMAATELSLNLTESRRQLIILEELGVIKEVYLDDDLQELAYSMNNLGYKA